MHLDLLLGPQAFARRRRELDRAAVTLYETTTRGATALNLARVHEREWTRLTDGQRDLLLEHLVDRILAESPPAGTSRAEAVTAAEPPSSRRGGWRARRRRSPRTAADGRTLAALAASAFGPFSVIALPWGFLALPEWRGDQEREPGSSSR